MKPNRLIILPAVPPNRLNSFEEERREVLDSVFEALCGYSLDVDQLTAYGCLLRHLTVGSNPAV